VDSVGREIWRYPSRVFSAERDIAFGRVQFSRGVGEEGPTNVAIALFSFPTIAAYQDYRRKAAEDPE
jgi:hypothetical protein